MLKKRLLALAIVSMYQINSNAQVAGKSDTLTDGKITRIGTTLYYDIGNGTTLAYEKPRKWDFILGLPKDAKGIVSTTFSRQSIKPLAAIPGSTIVLLLADDDITRGVRQFASNIGVDPSEKNKNALNFKLGGKEVSLLRLPANLNTAFYQLGQGFPSLGIGLGLFVYGKVNNDYRALSTASQLSEAFILMGVGTQLLKRISGRQSPSEAVVKGGKWDFLPSLSDYQNHTPNYDAFPSGHLATLMSSVTIFSQNYPDKKWIKPIGYSLTGLVALSMINNKVHWASDYPLAIGMGYLCARQVAKRSRREIKTDSLLFKKHNGELTYTFHYMDGVMMPGICYKF